MLSISIYMKSRTFFSFTLRLVGATGFSLCREQLKLIFSYGGCYLSCNSRVLHTPVIIFTSRTSQSWLSTGVQETIETSDPGRLF